MKTIKNTNNSPTVVSLFSGAGGMDLGFKNAGFNIIWANDNDSDSVKTYNINFGEHCVLADIENVPSTEIPNADVVIGGFPCQGFSVANMKRSKDDSRNKLYLEMKRVINDLKPKAFLAENVKGLLTMEKGEVFKMILKEFSDVGYDCKYTLFNAANYGVPQTRQRVMILGIRKDLNPNINFPPNPTHSKQPLDGLRPWVSIGEALSRIPEPDSSHNLKNHEYSKFKLKFNGYISNRHVDPDKPSPTITARGDNKGGAMIMHHPKNHRRLSCREAAAIQSFPLDFEFYGAMTSVYKQIGNAVPVKLAEAVAKLLYQYFETYEELPVIQQKSEPSQLQLIV